MSDFQKKFLLEDPRRLSSTGRYVALAAFGKHPGWDDHVEPRDAQEAKGLGLETESLNLAKTVFYVQGIGGQIDAGAWEKLDSAQQLPAFKHVFVWQRSGQILVGRLWSSSDGKGRTRFPMVVCLHFTGVPLAWALKHALPALAELEAGCTLTTSAAEVCSLLSRKRASLRDAIQSADGNGEYAPMTPGGLNRILPPQDESKSEGFLRVLYQIQSQLSTFTTGKFKTGSSIATLRAQQIRVPIAGETPEEALLFWTRFFLTQVDAAVPLLLTLPLEESWIDITVGEPESHEFFCLRASPKAVPMVSEVPYTLDDEFRAKAKAFLDDFRRGEKAAPDRKSTSTTFIPASAPDKSGWRKWLGVGVILVLGAGAAMLLLPKRDQNRPTAQVPSVTAEVAKPVAKPDVAPLAPPPVETSKGQVVSAKPTVPDKPPPLPLTTEKKETTVLAPAISQKPKATNPEPRPKATPPPVAEGAPKINPEPAPKVEPVRVASKPPESVPASARPSTIFVRRERTNSIGMVLVELPSGLWAGKYEVTHAEYRRVMGTNTVQPAIERRPTERVTWNEAREFCRKLTEMERSHLSAGQAYSLPTTKQWNELAAGQKFEELPGGGKTGRWFASAVGESTSANKVGLFDVLGNVWEWCEDSAGNQRVLRGGAFNSTDYERTWVPGDPVSHFGFRCVMAGP